MSAPDPVRTSFAVRVSHPSAGWRVELLADDAGDELPVLERALGEPGTDGWPPPFVLVLDSRLYFVVLRHGPGGMVRALISDATMLEWVLAAEVVERYGIGVDTEGAFDDDESGWPGGDLDIFTDDGLPHADLRAIVELNASLAADPRWETVLLPVADGLTMLRKR